MVHTSQLYYAMAIPVFILLLGVELWVAWRRGQRFHRFSDFVSSVGCGICQQMAVIFLGPPLIAGYMYLYEHLRLFTLPLNNPATWVLAYILVDFTHYWWHRLSHRVNFLWAVHVVHHQSEDFNFGVALRMEIFSIVTNWPFYVPMILLGFHPVVMATASALGTLYQFWIHTQVIGKLGPLESVLNTPSHHRVHHAVNPRYLDKNFASTFMLWDRLFGTFAVETEKPVFGITRPLRSLNPLWANVATWVELARECWQTPRLADKLNVWFRSPDWHPPGISEPERINLKGHHKYEPSAVPAAVRWYVGLNFVLAIAGTFLMLVYQQQLPVWQRALAVGLMMVSLGISSGLLEQRSWATVLEIPRLMLVAVLALSVLGTNVSGLLALALPAALALVLVTLVLPTRRSMAVASSSES